MTVVPFDKRPTASCANCNFFLRDTANETPGIGVCRRFPPSLADEDGAGLFPVLWDFDIWCGEWRLKDNDG